MMLKPSAVNEMGHNTLVLTRFNLPLRFGRSVGRDLGVVPGKTNLDPKWLRERVKLFHKFCLPSLSKQLDQIHNWYIIFDHATPNKIVDEICCMPKIVPIVSDSQNAAVNTIVKSLDLERPTLSLRLDSDDTLSKDFFTILNPALSDLYKFSSKVPLSISFQNGAEYSVPENKFFKRYYVGNPFLSVLERPGSIENFYGVFKTAHFRMQQVTNFLSMPTEKPMWCINVHGGNVANEIKGEESEEDYSQRFCFG